MKRLLLVIALSAFTVQHALAAELNLYSARHYDTDEALYADFERATGITINRIEGDADELIERIKLEGDASSADILLTTDAGRLWRAEQAGILARVDSPLLDEKVPAALRHPDGLWFGFSSRARLIYVNRELIDPASIRSYEDLANPDLGGDICVRSSSNIYNLSLLASLIAHHGLPEAQTWTEGVVGNFARPPEGNDTAQLRAAAAGACSIAIANSYYFARLSRSTDPADQEVAAKLAVVIPNQQGEGLAGRGAHINISGGGMLKHAPNPEAAHLFLEYLLSDSAQTYFADGNNEFPVVDSVIDQTTAYEIFGDFKRDNLNVSVLGENQPIASSLFDLASWK